MNWTLQYIASCLQNALPLTNLLATPLTDSLLEKNHLIQILGTEHWEDLVATHACINSTDAKQGSIFFCFKGQNADGHDYALDAAQRGAVAIIAERDPFPLSRTADNTLPPVFLVPSVLHALWRLAIQQRDSTEAQVIGITGTAGKTTIKESLVSLLSSVGTVAKNPRNLNTQIGLSLSIINADITAGFWVLEVGISQEHDMEQLGSLLQPNICIVLNAAFSHADGLEKLGVATHKANLATYTKEHGALFFNADYPKLIEALGKMKKELQDKHIVINTFSTRAPARWKATYDGLFDDSMGIFSVRKDAETITYHAPFVGSYGAENTAALVAVCSYLGLTPAQITTGLKKITLPAQRFSCNSHGSVTIIDDSYNANPLSSARMIEAAANMARETERELVLVMGEMLELGSSAEAMHSELGESMGSGTPSLVFWKGRHSTAIQKGLMKQRFSGTFCPVEDTATFEKILQDINLANMVILVKGSRSIRLEEFVKVLTTIVQGVDSDI